jgi:hypothetical protein
VVAVVLAIPLLALRVPAVVTMAAVVRAVLWAIAVGAGTGGAKASDGECSADGGKGNDPAYASRHDSPFAGHRPD